MNNILVIKSGRDSFEKVTNKFLENKCEIIESEMIIANERGLKKRNKAISFFKKEAKKYKKIIIFDDIILYLCSLLYSKNSYLWLWNVYNGSLKNRIRLFIANINHRVYTFDKNDAKKYNLKYNTQFFSKKVADSYKTSNDKTCNDMYFVGIDKGRYELLYNIFRYMKKYQMKPLFQMFPDDEKNYKGDFIIDQLIDYTDVLKNVQESKAVLDICKSGQFGMTYRAMEALFYDKKIVTNNTHYREIPFYSPEAIYFLEDGLEGLKDFIEAPKVKYDEKIKDYYSIENWFKRFE